MEPYNVKIRSEDSPAVLPISTTISSYGASYFASHVLPIVLTLSPKPPPGALVKVKGGLVGESALLLSGIELDGVNGEEGGEYRLRVTVQTRDNKEISSFIPAKLSATLLVTSVEKGKKSTEAIDILRILSGGNKPGEKVAECNSVEIDLLVGPCLSFAVSSVGPSSSHMVQVVAKSVVERATIDRVDLVKGASQLGRMENLPIDLEEEEEFCLPFVLDKSVEEQRSVTFTTTLKFDGGKELTSTYAVSLEPKGKGEIGGARGRHVPAMGFEKEGSSGGGGNTIINLNIRNPGNKSIVVGSVFAVEVEVELKSSAVTHINDLILFLVDGVDKVLPIDSSVSVGKMEVGEKRVCKVRFQGLRIGVAKIPEIQVFSKIEKVSYCSPSETDLDGLEVLIVEG